MDITKATETISVEFTSLIVAVFERISVEYTKWISSLSATQFTVEKPNFEWFAMTSTEIFSEVQLQTLHKISHTKKQCIYLSANQFPTTCHGKIEFKFPVSFFVNPCHRKMEFKSLFSFSIFLLNWKWNSNFWFWFWFSHNFGQQNNFWTSIFVFRFCVFVTFVSYFNLRYVGTSCC